MAGCVMSLILHAGNEHKLSYTDLRRKFADISPAALPSLLQHALAARQVQSSLDLQGDRSLLVPGNARARFSLPEGTLDRQNSGGSAPPLCL